MPGKSRHKGKKPISSKKFKAGKATTSAQPVAVSPAGVAVQRSMPVPPSKAPAAMAKQSTIRYDLVTAELRTIGIVAGIVLAILVILALVLS